MRQSAPLSKVWKLRVARCSSAPSATLGLLLRQNTYQTVLVALVLAQAARYADTAALFQALGGCWWNREDVPPQKAWEIQLLNKQPRHPPALRSRQGLRVSAHRLRKLGAQRFAEAGASGQSADGAVRVDQPTSGRGLHRRTRTGQTEASAAPPSRHEEATKVSHFLRCSPWDSQAGKLRLSVFFER